MKKIISIIISVFMCFSFSACSKVLDLFRSDKDESILSQLKEKYGTEILISGDFFDEEVMKAIELEWLQKPEKAQHDLYYSLPYQVKYYCYFSSIEDVKEYASYIFEELIEKQYLFGTCVVVKDYSFSNGEKYSPDYETVILSKNFDDYFSQGETGCVFWAYYTASEKQWVKEADRYAMPQAKALTVHAEKMDENGLYRFVMSVGTNVDPIYIREPNE